MITPPFLRGLRCAIIFLTRVPVGGDGYRDADWRWSTAWFPAVGVLIGSLLAGLWLIGISGLSPWVVAGLILSVNLMLTGGFHEDGLADTADALGGGDVVTTVLSADLRIAEHLAAETRRTLAQAATTDFPLYTVVGPVNSEFAVRAPL